MTKKGPAWTGKVRLVTEKLGEPLRWRKPRRVFVNSMSDLFHESLTDEDIDRVFKVMQQARQHVFQVLTKRPERMRQFLSERVSVPWGGFSFPDPHGSHIWLGVSVEDQATADQRIPLLLQTPAAVRFVSAEPLLGPVDLPWVWRICNASTQEQHNAECLGGLACEEVGLDWVIVGGESGPGARPCDVEWIRSIVEQCKSASVPCFVKQLGPTPVMQCDDVPESIWRDLDANGYSAEEIENAARGGLVRLGDRKGGDPSEWPPDLRVREFPR